MKPKHNLFFSMGYIAFVFLVIFLIGGIGFEDKWNFNPDSISPTEIFFIGYRRDQKIELWQASLNNNTQSLIFSESAKYSFALLPKSEQFFLGNCIRTGECNIDSNEMISRYWWDSLSISPLKHRLLWTETAEFCPPNLRYCDGGVMRIVSWKIDESEKKILSEIPYHISLLKHQSITSIRWLPNNREISFIETSKDAGWSNLKKINLDSLLITDIAQNVSEYKWAPQGSRIAYIESMRKIKIIDLVENQFLDVGSEYRYITDFTWSPDGNKLVFTATTVQGKSGVYVVDFVSRKESLLLESSGNRFYTEVNWSPNGAMVAIIQAVGDGETGQIILVNMQTPFSEAIEFDNIIKLDSTSKIAQWSWSPDGKIIAIQTTSQRENGLEIIFFDPEKREIISKFTQENYQAEWVFSDNRAIVVLLRSQDKVCPRNKIDKIGKYFWSSNKFSELSFSNEFINNLKNCDFSISAFTVGDQPYPQVSSDSFQIDVWR